MTPPTLKEKRVDWLYGHFQGITNRSDQLLILFGLLFVSAVAVLASSNDRIELPFLKVDAGRQTLLGSMILSGAFTLVAFFGNFDYGERALKALGTELGCGYDELWLVDTNPTIVDFAQYRRPETSARRNAVGRFVASLLYPMILVSALAWLSAMWAHEVWHQSMSLLEATPYIIGLPVLYVAWDRGIEYLRRRWVTFFTTERAMKLKPTGGDEEAVRGD